jgi:two-component system response regulator AlgR
MSTALKVLVVDDEPLARSRLKTLLSDLGEDVAQLVDAVPDAIAAMQAVQRLQPDVILLDVSMPKVTGLQLARELKALSVAPQIIFVTAHAEHALDAFELQATDYLTKPVRLERLQQALQRCQPLVKNLPTLEEALVVHERHQTVRVPIKSIVMVKAELKYLTLFTATAQHVHEGSLADLEARHPEHFVRTHRSTLVAKNAARALVKSANTGADDDADMWQLQVEGVTESASVSRRQLAAIKELIKR